jgi:serine protease inhibitor
MTRLLLANAIYFNAKWKIPFPGAEDDEFSLLDGQRMPVQMMHSFSAHYFARYVREEGYQAVELDYKGGRAQMIVLLPD